MEPQNTENMPVEKKKSSGKTALLVFIIMDVLIAVAVIAVFFMRGCANPPEPNYSSVVNVGGPLAMVKESCTLYVGDEASLEFSGGSGRYRFESADPNVVKVNEDGKITAVAVGTTEVTVFSGEAAVTCTVTVEDYTMKLSPEEAVLFVGSTTKFLVKGIPSDAKVEWSISDKKVAVVEYGKVTAVGKGTATVTAQWKNGEHTYTAEAQVKVETAGIVLDTYDLGTVYAGETRQIGAKVLPVSQAMTWTSSDAKVATVNGEGLVTAVGGGKAVITVTAGKYTAQCTVNVKVPGIKLSKESLTLLAGESSTLTVTKEPESAAVTWNSDNTAVATVSDGKVTAVGRGTANIRAVIKVGGKEYTASCAVTVKEPGISLSQSNLALTVGGKQTLYAETTPSGSSVQWSTGNSGVATVSGGTVTAVADGPTVVTATMTYNGKTYKATCNVTVAKPSISVSSNADVITFSPRDAGTCTVTAKLTPAGGKVVWESSDPGVAKVSGNGETATVTAVSAGTVTVKATYTVSGVTVSDSCTISVEPAGSTLSVDGLWYPDSGTCDSFRLSGTVSSNYPIVRMECYGTATSNALGITVRDSAEPLYVGDGVYSYDLAEATGYFINQYRKLYDAYARMAGWFGRDSSVTMNVTGTCYDAAGNSISFTLTYVIKER